MIGIVLYLFFLAVGFLYADMLFKDRGIYFRIWAGGITGNVLLTAGLMPFAFIFKFSVIAHILLAVCSAVPYFAIKAVRKEKILPSIGNGADCGITNKIFLLLILPLTLLICVLLTNHVLTPYPGGGVSSGQSTYGDLQMHLSFVTSIAEQKSFPPQYCQLSGYALNYPFLSDMLSSSLYLFGTPLRWAVLIPSYVLSFLLVMGFYILAHRVTGRKSAAVLASVLFFINGGFGFAYFVDGAKADLSVFTRMFGDYYHTPANYTDGNIRWVNTICDMIIPQRAAMLGWCMLMPALLMLIEAVKSNKTKIFVMLGILAGCMPMMHTHSFLALGIMSAVMFFAYLKGQGKEYIKNWIIYGVIACVMAFPQLMLWTFRQTGGNDAFLRFSFNWINEADEYFWFYLKNWGITAIFIIPAVLNAPKDNKKLIAGGACIMLVAEFIVFQPNKYDNNKLIFVTYMLCIMLISRYFVYLFEKMSDMRGRGYFAALIIFFGTFSGALTICREYLSGGQYQTFTESDIELSEYIRTDTPADAVFLTGGEVVNPVCALSGRTIYLGSSAYVYFHGFTKEYASRSKEVKAAYEGSYENMKEFCEKNGIEYIFVGSGERNDYAVNENMLLKMDKVYAKNGNALYKLK